MIRSTLSCLFAFAVIVAFAQSASAGDKEKKDVPPALDFKVKSLEGKEVDLSKYEGRVLLVVNVASRCGLTPQYEGLQELHEKHAKDGLAILAFPCNQFKGQEPGTAEEIREFCSTKYGVAFDLFEKIDVNGDDSAPLYKHLKKLKLKPKGPGDIQWNFEKFVIGRDGEPVARFEPKTKPDDPKLLKILKEELAKD